MVRPREDGHGINIQVVGGGGDVRGVGGCAHVGGLQRYGGKWPASISPTIQYDHIFK